MSEPNIQFKFDDTQNKLYALYQVTEGESLSVSDRFLREQIKEQGYAKLHFLDDGISEVIDIFGQPKAHDGKICIAEKRNAEVNILISKDKMEAYLTIIKAEGGKPATLESVKRKLAEKSVRHGFQPQAIKAAILNQEADEVLIAKGEPVINGIDAKFICLIKNIKLRTPKVLEDGHVDYRDLGEIMVVHPKEKLMRRDPATSGSPSKNICGETISPKPGKDTKFATSLEGSTPCPSNPNLLIATITGQPIICNNGVKVEKTMSIESVDLKSGNVIFDGSIIVQGDVCAGMKVKAVGDIKIKGMVENATIEAGGDINIKGAVIGRADNNAPTQEDLVIIEAVGSVSAKFVENARITAGHKIMIQDWVIKSTLHAINEVVVGRKDAKKGQIIGGNITSGLLVKAMNIGSHAGATTHIQVGNADDIETEKHKLGIQISQQTKALFALQKVFKELKNNPTKQAKETLKKALLSKQQFEKELIKLRMQSDILDKEKLRVRNAKVIVEKKVYSGTSINISRYNKDIQEDISGRTFSVREGKIVQKT